jgi:hypothetical protein
MVSGPSYRPGIHTVQKGDVPCLCDVPWSVPALLRWGVSFGLRFV